ncbi:MAG: hypothetical protein IJQ42_04585 [Oscillospiraceae bacterium]|nr:hypothetical protein [Oscillospiraceae bacterium]
MKYSHRLRKLEHTKLPVLSVAEQRLRLRAFIECETMVRGERPSGAEIEAERARLAQPIKQAKPEEIHEIAEMIERMIMNNRP